MNDPTGHIRNNQIFWECAHMFFWKDEYAATKVNTFQGRLDYQVDESYILMAVSSNPLGRDAKCHYAMPARF